MRITTTIKFCLACLLSFPLAASSDGLPDSSITAVAASAPVAIPAPLVNQPSLRLKDGRLLVAGGAAISNGPTDHAGNLDSEVWDADSGEWQSLGNDLRFDENQRVHLGQQRDERVLFFAVRGTEGGAKPEYIARRWDPSSNTVENLPVAIKPAAGTDIAVLGDGRVLVVNGLEGSADFWDSASNTVIHTEVPFLENLRWCALPLKSGQVLLVQTVPDTQPEGRKAIDHSTTLLWTPNVAVEWGQLGNLPIPFKRDSSLDETADGAARATADGSVYLLPAGAEEWSAADKVDPPQAANASSQTSVPAALPSGRAAGERSWWDKFIAKWEDIKWPVIATFIPILLFATLKHFDNLDFIDFPLPLQRFLRVIAIGSALGIVIIFVQAGVDIYAAERDGPPSWDQYVEAWDGVKWVVLAITIPIVLYFLLRRLDERGLSIFLLSTHRFLFISLMAFFAFLVWSGAEGSARFSSDECMLDNPLPIPRSANAGAKWTLLSETQHWANCVDIRVGLLGGLYFRSTKKRIMSLPAVPCPYIGTWSTKRNGVTYRFTFTDDSLFTVTPNYEIAGRGIPSGAWGVVDNEMIWLKFLVRPYTEPIVQRVELEGRNRFTLARGDGTKDVYELVDAIKSNTCSL